MKPSKIGSKVCNNSHGIIVNTVDTIICETEDFLTKEELINDKFTSDEKESIRENLGITDVLDENLSSEKKKQIRENLELTDAQSLVWKKLI